MYVAARGAASPKSLAILWITSGFTPQMEAHSSTLLLNTVSLYIVNDVLTSHLLARRQPYLA
jgi:hypothetical protein